MNQRERWEDQILTLNYHWKCVGDDALNFKGKEIHDVAHQLITSEGVYVKELKERLKYILKAPFHL